jgi:hypothetical protein
MEGYSALPINRMSDSTNDDYPRRLQRCQRFVIAFCILSVPRLGSQRVRILPLDLDFVRVSSDPFMTCCLPSPNGHLALDAVAG